MTTEETELRRFKLDVDLAEYNRCFGEISARFTYQTAAFTILAAGIGGILAFGRLTENGIAATVCLFAPLFIAPLGYIFFDNELQIWRIARYIRYTLRVRVAAVTSDDNTFAVDDAPFGTLAPTNAIPFLSVGRWFIFLFPALAAAIFAAPSALSAAWSATVLIIDFAAIAVLIAGIRAAIAEQITWRK